MNDTLSLILGGGRGARLYPLTRHRSEPAVPVAGMYRLIDVPVSNCLNNRLNRIYVLTQFLSVSLHRHIANTYNTNPFNRGFVEVLAAQQTNDTADWYLGTADALRQNIRYIESENVRDVLVLSGDQIYRMNFQSLIEDHRARDADLTIVTAPVSRDSLQNLGVLRVDEDNVVTAFSERPHDEVQLEAMRTPADWLNRHGIATTDQDYLANTGIYLFRRQALLEMLRAQPTAVDLVRDLLLANIGRAKIYAHLFTGYWADLGTIDTYYRAHMALVTGQLPFEFHNPDGIIYTRMHNLPSARVNGATLEQSLICDGCTIGQGATIQRSLVGQRARVDPAATLVETVMLGSDFYKAPSRREENQSRGVPSVGVGEGAIVRRAILDKDCRIGKGARIINAAGATNAEGPNYVIRDGIVVIPKAAVVRDGEVI